MLYEQSCDDIDGWINEIESQIITDDVGHDLTTVNLLVQKQNVCMDWSTLSFAVLFYYFSWYCNRTAAVTQWFRLQACFRQHTFISCFQWFIKVSLYRHAVLSYGPLIC